MNKERRLINDFNDQKMDGNKMLQAYGGAKCTTKVDTVVNGITQKTRDSDGCNGTQTTTTDGKAPDLSPFQGSDDWLTSNGNAQY